MEAQEQLIKEYILNLGDHDDMYTYLKEQIEVLQQLFLQERDGRLRLDLDIAELSGRFLKLEEEVYTILGLPHLCILCPRTEDDKRRVPAFIPTETSRIEFRCGHSAHTQCHFNMISDQDTYVADIRCSVCDIRCVSEATRDFFRDDVGTRTRPNVVQLWQTNPSFREDVVKICKMRRDCMKYYRGYSSDIQPVLKEFKESTFVHAQAISMYKKEYSKKITAASSRRAMLYRVRQFNLFTRAFNNKYDTYLNQLRALRGLEGVPRIPRSHLTIPYRFRGPVRRLLRVSTH